MVGWSPAVAGPTGGYTLARPADQIFLGEVFRTVDGPLAEVRGLRPHETAYTGAAEHLPVVWVAVRASLRRVLDETSLADVLDGRCPQHVEELAAAPDAWRNRCVVGTGARVWQNGRLYPSGWARPTTSRTRDAYPRATAPRAILCGLAAFM